MDYSKEIQALSNKIIKKQEQLDKDKFEVWYMTYNGSPKPWYRLDKFFINVRVI